jgi:hypothetical protein
MAWDQEPILAEAQPNRQSYATSQRKNASEPSAGWRPQFVATTPRLSFWKRIDWPQQFTPQRVAVLGAAAMAIALVTGISLAKRPASNDLPKQTRRLEPGGVTLSTHAPARVTSPSVSEQSRATMPRRSAAQHSARRRTSNEDGPEVITHYYNRKPSPVKQSTVAGVRHYTDMP